MIPYSRQLITQEDIEAVVEVLRSDFITQGPKIREFEEALASFCGARFAVVFSSGTAALHAAYFAAGLSAGDEFIVPAITFCATANAGVFLGARPIFCDVESDTGNLDPGELEKVVSSRTKLIVPVHYAGHPVDLEAIAEIAERKGAIVIEDACHALGAEYQGERIGSCRFSLMTVFSFHPVKPITTGEGGAVLTNSEECYRKLCMFREHGITREPAEFKHPSPGPWYYEMQFLGWNYRMTDFQAALGISQLRKLPEFIRRRRMLAELYRELLSGNPHLELPPERSYARSGYHLFPVRLKDKALLRKGELVRRLRDRGIGVQVHYLPVYSHPFYRRLGYAPGLCPQAEEFYRRELSLPLYPGLKEEDLRRVVEILNRTLEEVVGE